MDPNLPVVDHQGAMDRLDGDEELWQEIRVIWLEDAPQMLETVRAACHARDADAVKRSAHALKGASSNVGAVRVAEAARFLEASAPAADWSALDAGFSALDREIALAIDSLAALAA